MSRKKHAEKIKLDVIDWSKQVLEPMNKHLGFPACPFAAKWRKDGKLRIEVRSDKSKYEKHLTALLKDWNKKQHDILIFCDPYYDQYSLEQFQEKIDFYNKTYNRRDVYFMGFHPENPASIEEQEFLVEPTDETTYDNPIPYSMMLIQKFKQLYEASCKLHKIGYYKNLFFLEIALDCIGRNMGHKISKYHVVFCSNLLKELLGVFHTLIYQT